MPSLLVTPGQPRSPQAIRRWRGAPEGQLGHPQARWMRRRGFRLCRSLMVLPMILGRLGRPRSAGRAGKRPPGGPELIRAGLDSRSRQPDVRDCRNDLRSSVRRRVPASQGDEPESAGAAAWLARVPRPRPGTRAPLLLMREESGASGGKDPGYGNNAVPWEFAG